MTDIEKLLCYGVPRKTQCVLSMITLTQLTNCIENRAIDSQKRINMVLVEKFALVVPVKAPKAFLAAEHGKLECYQGTRATNNFGITAEGAGPWVEGNITGSLEAYDYKALYKVYNLKDSESR